MSKNIVICCDGTGNQLGETYSNVVKLFAMAEKSGRQFVYYDPGVGTHSHADVVIPMWRKIRKLADLAFGMGLEKNVTEAYAYLMETYEPGDRIFLFGFSRGAYSIRVLAGLITEMGLLSPKCHHLIPYKWDYYRLSYQPTIRPAVKQFRDFFTRMVPIHFIGIWDTVSSIGLLFGHRSYPNTFRNSGIAILRHALAIDERRRFYRTNLFQGNDRQDVKQVWFAGVHSDVGGSYSLNSSALAQISLQWMVREAVVAGLYTDPDALDRIIPKQDTTEHQAPSHRGKLHKSLNGLWWLLELLPKRLRSGKIRAPLGQPREMFIDPFRNPIKPTIHSSVIDRIQDPLMSYNPVKLRGKTPADYNIEK